jgi:hypothetical protein
LFKKHPFLFFSLKEKIEWKAGNKSLTTKLILLIKLEIKDLAFNQELLIANYINSILHKL